jgi:hypothetical protein
VKKLHASPKLKQRAYIERKKVKQEEAAEIADALATIKRLNLCSFGEIACDIPARTWLEEVQTHRSWLRALQQPEILPGESLKELARRTWQALLDSKGYCDTDGDSEWVVAEDGSKQWQRGFGVSYPLFDPQKQHFQIPFDSKRFPDGPFIVGIRDGAKPGWFDQHWKAPKDCTGDEPIDIASLPPLPPMQQAKKPELKQPERTVVEQPQDFVYEIPPKSDYGTYGLSRTSHL